MAVDWQQVLDPGLTRYLREYGDRSDAATVKMLLSDVADGMAQAVKPDDVCDLGLPSVVIRPDIRTSCLVVFLADRAVLAWRKGVLRKTTVVETIPRAEVQGVEIGPGLRASTRGARTVRVRHSRGTTEFSVPTTVNVGLEGAILAALEPGSGAASPSHEPGAASAEGLHDWQATPSGLFCQTSDGRITGATCLVDPTAPRSAQLAQLSAIGWLPPSAMTSEADRLAKGLRFEEASVPEGRARLPLPYPWGAEVANGDTGSQIHGYLWPEVDSSGRLALEDGEEIVTSWTSEQPSGHRVEDDLYGQLGHLLVADREAADFQWTLTNQRLVLFSTMPSAATGRAAMHIRFEWVCGLNVESYDYLGKRENTLLGQLVCGDPTETRFALGINDGLARVSLANPVLSAVRAQLTGFGLEFGAPATRTSDNGKKGVLTRQHFSVTGGWGLSMPADLLQQPV